jgi:hypothetical protein
VENYLTIIIDFQIIMFLIIINFSIKKSLKMCSFINILNIYFIFYLNYNHIVKEKIIGV